ncbi:U-box domain-containing protein 16 [Plakobranchus ocellatus]|uniref:U-box domain-containing protein 16 n=1 Tax=Plakobranchus ocellatus TaxID=259542 RepID=A0AAV3ZMQ3_9GAST|nr:U-box domain-containing protein 16 [Plakobranchus ocellatus]
MECFKQAIFTRRLTVFNETFAELGSKQRNYAAVWHGGISGRKDEDLASTFHSYMLNLRGMKRVVYWLDTCGAQNKNSTLFTMLLYLVNSKIVVTETVELKFLEKGHTFMSVDSKHKKSGRR